MADFLSKKQRTLLMSRIRRANRNLRKVGWQVVRIAAIG